MKEHPYLIALALIEGQGNRAMPLGGKSLKETSKLNYEPGDLGEKLSLQLLLRVLQRSEDSYLRRAAGDKSLLLIQISSIEVEYMIVVNTPSPTGIVLPCMENDNILLALLDV